MSWRSLFSLTVCLTLDTLSNSALHIVAGCSKIFAYTFEILASIIIRTDKFQAFKDNAIFIDKSITVQLGNGWINKDITYTAELLATYHLKTTNQIPILSLVVYLYITTSDAMIQRLRDTISFLLRPRLA